MFEQEIAAYEKLRQEYQTEVSDRMNNKEWMEYNEVLFSTHSCAIEEAIESGTHHGGGGTLARIFHLSAPLPRRKWTHRQAHVKLHTDEGAASAGNHTDREEE